HLVEVFRALRPVLRDDATVWCEIGDTFITHPAGFTGAKRWKASGLSNRDNTGAEQAGSFDKRFGPIFRGRDMSGHAASGAMEKVVPGGLPEGNQTLVPHRVAIALQDDGWVVRQTYVWARPNPMPESVRNRGTSCHSYIFQLVKGKGYYWDREMAREAMAPSSAKRSRQPSFWSQHGGEKDYSNGTNPSRSARQALENVKMSGAAGRNMRSVWTIPTHAFPGKHYATFPPEIPRRCISISTSERGCCPECGAPFERVTSLGEPDREWQRSAGGDADGEYSGTSHKTVAGTGAQDPSEVKRRVLAGMAPKVTVGWRPTCGHFPDPCDKCGAAWVHAWVHRRVSSMNIRVRDAKKGILDKKSGLGGENADATEEEIEDYGEEKYKVAEADVSWPGCGCRALVPAVVLDPFAGSGTTLHACL
ncbi:MAG: DNA methyltransferase, partial [Thermoplasmata archaeon]